MGSEPSLILRPYPFTFVRYPGERTGSRRWAVAAQATSQSSVLHPHPPSCTSVGDAWTTSGVGANVRPYLDPLSSIRIRGMSSRRRRPRIRAVSWRTRRGKYRFEGSGITGINFVLLTYMELRVLVLIYSPRCNTTAAWDLFLADPSAWPDGMASDMFLLVPLAFMRACAPWSCLGGVNSKQERAAGCRRPQMAMGMSASPVGHAQPQMAWHIHLHKGMNRGQHYLSISQIFLVSCHFLACWFEITSSTNVSEFPRTFQDERHYCPCLHTCHDD